MSSYADIAAKGPTQTDEEKRAPPPPEILHEDSMSTSSLIDVDTPSVHTVSSDFSSQPIQTETQAARLEHEFQAKIARAEEESKKAAAHAKKDGKKAKKTLLANKDNPVVIGNAVALALLTGVLGFGAWKKHSVGQLSWKLVGIWTGAVGLFAGADYYLSSYLFENKYPPKK